MHRDSGRLYIGQTTKAPEWRWGEHCRSARLGRQVDNYFVNALRAYGEDAFYVTSMCVPLVDVASDDPAVTTLLDLLEVDLIARYGTQDRERGFNTDRGGNGSTAAKRRKGAAANRGRKLSPEHRRRLSQAHMGHVHTDEHRRRISKALVGRPRPPEIRMKISETKRMRGSVCSIETRQKLSAAMKGRTTKMRGTGRSFVCTFPDGSEVTFDSPVEALEAVRRMGYSRVYHSSIYKCAHGLYKQTDGLVFRFADVPPRSAAEDGV